MLGIATLRRYIKAISHSVQTCTVIEFHLTDLKICHIVGSRMFVFSHRPRFHSSVVFHHGSH